MEDVPFDRQKSGTSVYQVNQTNINTTNGTLHDIKEQESRRNTFKRQS
jgi:hypothetical protein